MNCPRCGIEVPAGNTVCSACRASVVPGDPLSASPAGVPAPAPSSSITSTILAAVGSLLCLAMIVGLSLVSTRRTYHSITAEGYGYLFGRCLGAYLLPLIGVLLYYKVRRKKPTMARRVSVISIWALGFAFLSFNGELQNAKSLSPDELSRHIGDLAKQAAGQVPVSPDKTKWDSALRSYFADIKSFNEQYQQEIAQLDASALKTLYTADSFRSPENVTQILSQLHATLDLDEKYASMQPIADKFKERVRAVDAPDSEKEEVLKSFESSARPNLALREAVLTREREWFQASIDLYEFMQFNQSAYSVRGGKVFFNKTGLAGTFNENLKKAIEFRSVFSKAQEAFDKTRGQNLNQIGLQPSDLSAPGQK